MIYFIPINMVFKDILIFLSKIISKIEQRQNYLQTIQTNITQQFEYPYIIKGNYISYIIMPPKSKKEQQQQAKRLQQQQKRKQEQQARLAQERKRYSSQTITTGLLLPASNQIFIDLSQQDSKFIRQKLKQSILSAEPNINTDQHFLNLVLKELLHYCIDALAQFGLSEAKKVEGNQESLMKARIFVGIAYRIMINEHTSVGGSGKSKQKDEKLFKELLIKHVSKGDGKLKIFTAKQLESILAHIKKTYFNHFLILFNFTKFKKREDVLKSRVFINSATSFDNKKDTPFTDLRHKIQPKKQA